MRARRFKISYRGNDGSNKGKYRKKMTELSREKVFAIIVHQSVCVLSAGWTSRLITALTSFFADGSSLYLEGHLSNMSLHSKWSPCTLPFKTTRSLFSMSVGF